jgi:acyl-CoA thioester hydrolase
MMSDEVDLPAHAWPVRVYFEDTDAGGVVYHGNYLKFAERARTELLRAGGFDHTGLAKEHAVLIVVRDCTMEFIAPARLDDALEVRSRVTTIGGASLTMRQEVFRPMPKLAMPKLAMPKLAMPKLAMPEAGGDKLLVRLDLRLACIDRDFRPARLPPALKHALSHIKAI